MAKVSKKPTEPYSQPIAVHQPVRHLHIGSFTASTRLDPRSTWTRSAFKATARLQRCLRPSTSAADPRCLKSTGQRAKVRRPVDERVQYVQIAFAGLAPDNPSVIQRWEGTTITLEVCTSQTSDRVLRNHPARSRESS